MRRKTIALSMVSLLALEGCESRHKSAGLPVGEYSMKPFPEHPGKIKMMDLFHRTSKIVSIEDIPENRRFVYLKDGVETHDPSEATERVPIVEVQMLSSDERGNLVSPENAKLVEIKEFGPDMRPLRSTIMRR
jgi:hypothetical protein